MKYKSSKKNIDWTTAINVLQNLESFKKDFLTFGQNNAERAYKLRNSMRKGSVTFSEAELKELKRAGWIDRNKTALTEKGLNYITEFNDKK
jgi:hypothetical protein